MFKAGGTGVMGNVPHRLHLGTDQQIGDTVQETLPVETVEKNHRKGPSPDFILDLVVCKTPPFTLSIIPRLAGVVMSYCAIYVDKILGNSVFYRRAVENFLSCLQHFIQAGCI